MVFAPVPTPGRPPARCPLSGGPPRVWPYAPRRVVPDAFVLRQLVRRGCLCPLTRPSLVAKPTRRIESAFVGVYGRLKIFEFRVVGLFTQPAANENPYPMKGLLAIATRFPRLNRLGSIRRVNWSSRLALQTFETAEPPRLCGRFSPVVTCFSLTNQTHAATPGGTHHGLVWDGRHPRRRGIPRGQGHVRGHVLPQLRRRAAGVQRGSRRHPTRAQERKGGAEPRGLLSYHCDREQGRRDDLERTAAGAVRQERPSRPEGDHRGASEALSLCKTSTGDADSVFPLLIL